MANRAIAVVTTTGDLAVAQRLATEIVELKLAASAQISTVQSVYRWQGTVHHAPEFQVTFKTMAVNYAAIEAAILARHAYELPEIYAIALEQTYRPYQAWIAANSQA